MGDGETPYSRIVPQEEAEAPAAVVSVEAGVPSHLMQLMIQVAGETVVQGEIASATHPDQVPFGVLLAAVKRNKAEIPLLTQTDRQHYKTDLDDLGLNRVDRGIVLAVGYRTIAELDLSRVVSKLKLQEYEEQRGSPLTAEHRYLFGPFVHLHEARGQRVAEALDAYHAGQAMT